MWVFTVYKDNYGKIFKTIIKNIVGSISVQVIILGVTRLCILLMDVSLLLFKKKIQKDSH